MSLKTAAVGICLVSVMSCARQESPVPFDLIVRGGQIIEGSGSPAVTADLGVRDGRIAAIGQLGDATAKRVIDARGLAVTPGFIDLHTHSEDTIPVDGNAESQVRQGVTLVMMAEGQGTGPLGSPAALEVVKQNMAVYGADVTWNSIEDYFAQLMKKGSSVNVATYVSFGMVKRSVMNYEEGNPTPEQLQKMKALVTDAMENGGAWGIHAVFPEDGTYDELAKEVHRLKVRGKPLWGKLDEPIRLIEEARAEGLKVTANQYPYTAMQHEVEVVIPPWVKKGSKQDFVARLKDPATRARIKRDPEFIAHAEEHGGWEHILVAMVKSEKNKKYEGKSIAEIAKERGLRDPADACLQLMSEEENGWVFGIHFSMSEDDVRRIMKLPWVSIASDARALATTGVLAQGRPHPRSFGTNPRVLGKYVREEHILTLEDAVRKMTGLPASILGLKDRGLLKEGMAADIVLFDPETVIDKATYQEPFQYPAGIPFVIVNGIVVIDGGQHTGARPGQVVWGPAYKDGPSGRPEQTQ
jgi:N-acyl-D-aspartate/D-glutamate deacylase